MKGKSVETIIESAIEGNEAPFNQYIENVCHELLPKLIAITSSVEDAKDVFIRSVQKFWERFVLQQETLPDNPIAYLFMMCKNAWLMQKRNKWNLVTLIDEPYKYGDIESNENPLSEKERSIHEEEYFMKQKALTLAMEKMSGKCKALIETELDNRVKLKDLQNDLGFTNYQALVQAKYNCKKRLIRLVFDVLKELRSI